MFLERFKREVWGAGVVTEGDAEMTKTLNILKYNLYYIEAGSLYFA